MIKWNFQTLFGFVSGENRIKGNGKKCGQNETNEEREIRFTLQRKRMRIDQEKIY